MVLIKNKQTRALIVIMCALAFLALSVAKVYYKHENESVDPRIRSARVLYEKYNQYAQTNNFDSVFFLMDTIESIYAQHKHYRNSYEVGVLYNNRAAAYLTLAMHVRNEDGAKVLDSLFNLAQVNSSISIQIYTDWLSKFDIDDEAQLKTIIETDFFSNEDYYSEKMKSRYLRNRVKDIQLARNETKRRLSVSYTNLGIVFRHKLNYEEAVQNYKKALDLWERNLTARNNMNILLNRPIEKRNLIQKVFPPAKNKQN